MDDYDAEDLPHWWQRWIAEGAGVIILVAVLLAAVVVGNFLGPALPAGLDWLSGFLQ